MNPNIMVHRIKALGFMLHPNLRGRMDKQCDMEQSRPIGRLLTTIQQ